MSNLLDLSLSANFVFYIIVSIAFVVGILLMVAPEAFDKFNIALQKEYGIKKRLIPVLEDTEITAVDKIIRKNTVTFGMFISITAFILLMIYK